MALNVGTSSMIHHLSKPSPLTSLNPKHDHLFIKLHFPFSSSTPLLTVAAQSEGRAGREGVTEEEPQGGFIGLPSTHTQLDLLKRLTSTSPSSDGYLSDGDSSRPTIRDQLYRLVGDRDGEDFSIPLGKNLKKVSATFLTTSQKRNIKRQAYLNDVSRRNDTNFFATIAAFVILPPILILVVAVLTGYIELLP